MTAEYDWLWTLALAAALYLPVRKLIWVLYVRRAERDGNEDAARRGALKRRAGITAALLSFVFAYLYVATVFGAGA
jgi:hypothetical protein